MAETGGPVSAIYPSRETHLSASHPIHVKSAKGIWGKSSVPTMKIKK